MADRNGRGRASAALGAGLALAGLIFIGASGAARAQSAGAGGAAPAAIRLPVRTYEQGLVERTLARHPGVRAIRLHLGVGGAALAAGGGAVLVRPLTDSMGAPVGAVEVAFGSAEAASAQQADAVARDLGRHIYLPSNLADPEPFAGHPPTDTYAQALVDQAMAADGELVTLAMHVAPPGASDGIIIASNFGRLGKPSDADDAAVTAGKVIQEVTSGGRRLAVELPLHDARGATLGALSTSFRLAGPDRRDAVLARATALRDALARQIPSLERLCGPVRPPA